MIKGFHPLRKTDVVMRRGADPLRMLKYLQVNTYLFKRKYKVILLHIGTNHFSTKEEWGQYLNLVNDQCTWEEYNNFLSYFSPNPAKGSANAFKEIFGRIINLINRHTNALILISGIIPRPWDDDRRGAIIATYNKMLRSLNDRNVFYINTPNLFLTTDHQIISRLFSWDGLHLNVEGHKQLQSYWGERIWANKNLYNL